MINLWFDSYKISFIIEKLVKHQGEGELFALYKKYKNDFEKKGYFLPNEKLNIPKKIETSLLLTSENGDAIKDFIFTLDNNNSTLEYDSIDVPVQGKLCPQVLIEKLTDLSKKYDVIVITRGGGSFEDLFCFQELAVVEAIVNCKTPIISGIGHETDRVNADLAADYAAATPSQAAEIAVFSSSSLAHELNSIKKHMTGMIDYRLEVNRNRLGYIELSIRNFDRKLEAIRHRIDLAGRKLDERLLLLKDKLIFFS